MFSWFAEGDSILQQVSLSEHESFTNSMNWQIHRKCLYECECYNYTIIRSQLITANVQLEHQGLDQGRKRSKNRRQRQKQCIIHTRMVFMWTQKQKHSTNCNNKL